MYLQYHACENEIHIHPSILVQHVKFVEAITHMSMKLRQEIPLSCINARGTNNGRYMISCMILPMQRYIQWRKIFGWNLSHDTGHTRVAAINIDCHLRQGPASAGATANSAPNAPRVMA